MNGMVIAQLGFDPHALRGETVLVTGAGGGIGFETARALLWLGANVIIAEIDAARGQQAAEALCSEFGGERFLALPTDVSEAASVERLYRDSLRRFGKVDSVINNATVAVLGSVIDTPIEAWDRSFAVNLRGPVLLARAFLPAMIDRAHGVFACVSSTGTAFMGAYESLKAAQVHLGNTLDAELEGTGVIAYTIGPGLVMTDTAQEAVERLAPMLGMSMEEFTAMNLSIVLSPEEAGTGFAASVVMAERFRGQEISSTQALRAAPIPYLGQGAPAETTRIGQEQGRAAWALSQQVYCTLKEQSEGWKQRSLFERQWVLRDFRRMAGMPAEEWLSQLEGLMHALEQGESLAAPPLPRLEAYYAHLAELARGYEKDPAKLEENLKYIEGWRGEVQRLIEALQG